MTTSEKKNTLVEINERERLMIFKQSEREKKLKEKWAEDPSTVKQL